MQQKVISAKSFMLTLSLIVLVSVSGCERLRNYSDQEHVQRAKDFQAKSDFKAAGIELKNALNKNPKNAEARWLLGEVYLELGQGAAAQKELEQAQALGINVESVNVPLGRAYLLQGKQQQVLDEIQATPQFSLRGRAQILKLRGDALLGLLKGKEACELFTASNKTDPEFIDAYWGLSLCSYALDKDESRAKAMLDHALKLDPKNSESWVKIAEWEQNKGNFKEAEAAYNEAIKLKFYHRQALFNRTLLFLATNRISQAEKDVEALRRQAPASAETLFLTGTLHFYKKEYDKARNALGRLEKFVPNYAPAVLLNAMVAYATRSYGAAEQYVGRYLASRPNDEKAIGLKARIYLQTARPALALSSLMPLVKESDLNPEFYALIGQAYMQLRDYIKATEFLERAAAMNPKSASAQAALARGYLASGQGDRGVAVLMMASELDAAKGEADTLLAMHYLGSKQYDKALSALTALERKEPKNPVTHNLKGNAYQGKGDSAQARKHWETAVDISPGYLPAASNLARLDIADKNIDSAKKRYLTVLEKDSNNIAAMLALADIAYYEKQIPAYLKWLERAASADRNAMGARARLVGYYLSIRKPQQALALAREAASNNPGDLQALDLLGRTQFEAGQYENALASYTQLVDKAPDQLAARIGLAGVQMVLGRHEEARANLAYALKANPNNLGVLHSMASLLIDQGKLEDAAVFARQAQVAHPKAVVGYALEGDIKGLQKRWPEAIQLYERAFFMQPSGQVISRLHEIQVRAGLASQADTKILQWLKQNAADVTARTYLAESYLRRGMKPQAIEQYETLLQQKPNHVLAMNNLAGIYLSTKDPRALKYAEKAYGLMADNAAIMDTYGWALINFGEAPKGLDLLSKAKSAAPGIPTIHFHYAVALEKMGQQAKAKQELRAVLETKKPFPERADAERLLNTMAPPR